MLRGEVLWMLVHEALEERPIVFVALEDAQAPWATGNQQALDDVPNALFVLVPLRIPLAFP